jgi:hypothetical protein
MRKDKMEDIWLMAAIALACGCILAATSYTFLNWIP